MSTVDNILDIWFEYPVFNLKKKITGACFFPSKGQPTRENSVMRKFLHSISRLIQNWANFKIIWAVSQNLRKFIDLFHMSSKNPSICFFCLKPFRASKLKSGFSICPDSYLKNRVINWDNWHSYPFRLFKLGPLRSTKLF